MLPFKEEVIAAQPGWFLLTYVDGRDLGSALCRDIILAWLLQFYRDHNIGTLVEAIPVTVDGNREFLFGDYALQFGDEPKFYTGFEEYTDEASLVAYFKRTQRRS
jgi:hypothetical protein